jgi:hypothetical protein
MFYILFLVKHTKNLQKKNVVLLILFTYQFELGQLVSPTTFDSGIGNAVKLLSCLRKKVVFHLPENR